MTNIVQIRQSGETFTTSLAIAEKFNKRHGTILRKIDSLPKDEFGRRNFAESSYLNQQNKSQRMYEITRDGFTIIAMGLTGKDAYEWKVKFIDAFNKMERHLRNATKKVWLEHKNEAGIEYRVMSRALDESRRMAGKETKSHHYANEAKLVNWALTGKFTKVDRDKLSKNDLGMLINLEAYNAVLLSTGYDREARKRRLKDRFNELTEKYLIAA